MHATCQCDVIDWREMRTRLERWAATNKRMNEQHKKKNRIDLSRAFCPPIQHSAHTYTAQRGFVDSHLGISAGLASGAEGEQVLKMLAEMRGQLRALKVGVAAHMICVDGLDSQEVSVHITPPRLPRASVPVSPLMQKAWTSIESSGQRRKP